MTAADPRAVESIFVALSAMTLDERAESLDRMCDGKPELRREVESLLRFHDAPDGGALDRSPLLNLTAGMAAIAAADESTLPPRPTAAGFTLTSVLGSGGMGVVYVAEQHRPKRTVALKVIRRSAAQAEMLRRFEHEAEVLARLQHPGIAQIFEAGVADFGHGPQPFIAMELVRGPDLVRAAREGNYSTRRRLEVMAGVSDAVQHAHQRGVIHRDLKPANILVVDEQPTRDGEEGKRSDAVVDFSSPSSSVRLSSSTFPALPQPKILDFGVARVTDADVQVTIAATGVGQLVGTLPYMSPEQVAGEPRDIDTRCDVYALGVILYELLAGRLPHDVSSRSIPEAARIIREESPARLSALNPVFRGDVDTIVNKALEKDPERRYQSAAELGADIRRFLNDEPIVARRSSALYQFRKFAERNKRFVAAVAIGVMLVLATAIVSMIFGIQAHIAQRNAQTAKSAAESRGRIAASEADKARWSAYLANLAAAQSSLRANDLFVASRRLNAADVGRHSTFEWRHLNSRLDDSVAVIARPGPFTAIAVSPDGRTLASGGANGNVFLWKTATRDAFLSLPHGGIISALVFSPDGTVLFSAGNDGAIRFWDTRSGSALGLLSIASRAVYALHLSDDGRLLLVSARDKPVQIWDLDNDQILREFTSDGVPSAVAISPDGTHYAAAFPDRNVRVYDLRTPEKPPIVLPHNTLPDDLAFDSTARRLVAAGNDHVMYVWDLASASIVDILRGHKDIVSWCRFSADDSELISGSHDGTLRLWNVATGEEVGVLRAPGSHFVRVAADKDLVNIVTLGFDQSIRLWDAAGARDSGAIHSGARNLVMTAVFSPDSRRFATGTNDGIVRIWDAESAMLVAALHGHEGYVQGVAFTPDGSRLVSGSVDATLRIWNMRNGRCEAVLTGHEDDIFGVAMAPNGRVFASASQDSTIRIWDLESRETLAVLRGHKGPVRFVAFSPDSRLLASAGADGTVRLWDVASGEPRGVLKGHTNIVNAVAFSPDGLLLVSTSDDHTARLWDVDSHAPAGQPLAHAEAVTGLCFSPDGSRLATGSGDAAVHLWDMPSGEEVAVLREHKYVVLCVNFAPDGSRLISGSLDKYIRLWETTPLSARIDARQKLLALKSRASAAADEAIVNAAATTRGGASPTSAPSPSSLIDFYRDLDAAAEAIEADSTLEPNLQQGILNELLRRGAEAGVAIATRPVVAASP